MYWYFSIFFNAFLSATLIPLGSELTLLVAFNYADAPLMLCLVASVGNTLGGLTNFFLGHFAKWDWITRYLRVKRTKIDALSQRFQAYGSWPALLCWLPVIGDPLAIVLGFTRQSWIKVTGLMWLGKLLRYLVLWYVWKLGHLT